MIMLQSIFELFQSDFDSTSEWFKFKGESIVHGDTTLKSLLKNSILNYDLELSASSVMADFEINWRKAILDVFPFVALIGK